MKNFVPSSHILSEDGWAYVAPTLDGGTSSREWQRKFPSLWHAVSAASQDLLVAADLVRNKQVKARLMLHWDTVNGIAHALDRYARQPHSPVNQPAVSAPSLLEQGRLEEQHQPDQGMTSTSGDAQTSCPPVNCSNGTAREQLAREGSCNASSLERSGSIDAERDNTTVTNAPAPSSPRAATIEDYRAVLKQARDFISFLKGDEYTVAGHCIDQVLAMPDPTPQTHVKWPEFGSFGSATAMMDVIDERLRQQRVEGWRLEDDDIHTNGELAGAAACYILHKLSFKIPNIKLGHQAAMMARELWPWAWSWWKPTDRRRDLVKAAALLIAEIERLDRAALATEGKADG